MATNSIIPFCPTDTGTNLLTDASYLAASDRTNGNQPGIASQRLVNKALRQSSLMSAGLAQWAANRSATNVADTLTPTNIETILAAAVNGSTPGRLIAIRSFFSNQTYTATFGTASVLGLVVGGGGAGGGCFVPAAGTYGAGGGAGGGGYSWFFTTVAAANGQFMTVGPGGIGIVSSNGQNGSTSSFGSLVSASGGTGGGGNFVITNNGGSSVIGGAGGGMGFGGFMNGAGIPGDWALFTRDGTYGGRGGASVIGAGGGPSGPGTSGGLTSLSVGGGGGGCSLPAGAGPAGGGNGGQGAIWIWEYT